MALQAGQFLGHIPAFGHDGHFLGQAGFIHRAALGKELRQASGDLFPPELGQARRLLDDAADFPADVLKVAGQIGRQGRALGEAHLLQAVQGLVHRLGHRLPGRLQLQVLIGLFLGHQQVRKMQKMVQLEGLGGVAGQPKLLQHAPDAGHHGHIQPQGHGLVFEVLPG